MKGLNVISVAFTIVGAFIGAGFVSGQELWQFFGKFGAHGFIGLLVAVIAISFLTFAIIKNGIKTKSHSFETIITGKDSPVLKKNLIAIETVFYFSIYVIMTAGVQSLVNQAFQINKMLIGIIFATLITVVSIMGVKWIVSVFSATVPILTVSVIVIAIVSYSKCGITLPEATNSNLLPALFSAVVFVSYNFIAGIGVFASLSRQIKNTKKLAVSSVVACAFLFILGCAILVSVFSCAGAELSDLPMITVVTNLNGALGSVYSVLLIFAMIGASLASLFPIAEIFKKSKVKQVLSCTLISILCVALSSFGFKELISTVYPAFGYIGFIVIAMVLSRYFKKEK